jgi:hypothetical protein
LGLGSGSVRTSAASGALRSGIVGLDRLMAANHPVLYERLFLLNRCLEQVSEIIEQFQQDGVVHAVYAGDRKRSVEELRADLSHVLTGMLHQRELEACVKAVGVQSERGSTNQK